MPTGYTSWIHDGKEDKFVQYASRCARAFGALVLLRDDPTTAELPKDPGDEQLSYYEERRNDAEMRLARLSTVTESEANERADKEFAERVREHGESVERYRGMRERYDAMLAKVRRWDPPTDDHVQMKGFMLDQLHQSRAFDCLDPTAPKRRTGSEWLSESMSRAQRDLRYYTDELKKGRERAAGRKAWLDALRESLDSYEE